MHFGANARLHKKFPGKFKTSHKGEAWPRTVPVLRNCHVKSGSLGNERTSIEWHKLLDLGAFDAFYDREFGSFCQNGS
jgi:hypothetical protein